MGTATTKLPPNKTAGMNEPRFIRHSSFDDANAEQLYDPMKAEANEECVGFMLDEVTRDCAKRMHYAAWRASTARTRAKKAGWLREYYEFRNRIVVGNQKLTFRAVQKWHAPVQHVDEMTAECQIVLIRAVAAFNPWIGIRFSTYAFTCLMRALSRLSARHAADRLSQAIPLESVRLGQPLFASEDEAVSPDISRLDRYFEEEHNLLTSREKVVLIRRFHLRDEFQETETLEQVGRDLSLSKERVRQVQISALQKLRSALSAG